MCIQKRSARGEDLADRFCMHVPEKSSILVSAAGDILRFFRITPVSFFGGRADRAGRFEFNALTTYRKLLYFKIHHKNRGVLVNLKNDGHLLFFLKKEVIFSFQI